MKSPASLFRSVVLLTGTLVAIGVPAASAGTPPPALPPSSASSPAPEPTPGLIGLRLLEAPVARRDDPRALIYIVDHVKPGTTISRRVELSNKTQEKRHMELYPAAAAIKKDTFTFGDGHASNELASWTSVDHPKQELAPWAVSQARVTIKVPKTAAPGERYAVLWAENRTPPDAQHNIGSITRVGVRIYLDVEIGAEYCDFKIKKLTAVRDKAGRPSVVASVRNTGKRALDLSGKLNLTNGPGAMSAGPYQVTPGTTLPPGESGNVVVPLDSHLPNGPWTATLHLESGTVKRQVEVKMTLPRPGAMSEATFVGSSGIGLGAGIALVLGGALTVGVIWFRRRPRA